jgi:hypothetical protein
VFITYFKDNSGIILKNGNHIYSLINDTRCASVWWHLHSVGKNRWLLGTYELPNKTNRHNVMFCSPCISIYACIETNLMQCSSSVYSVTIPLHVSGLPVAHHKAVIMYICNKWYVLYVLAWPAESQLKSTTRTSCCICTLLPPDDGQLASPKHVEV